MKQLTTLATLSFVLACGDDDIPPVPPGPLDGGTPFADVGPPAPPGEAASIEVQINPPRPAYNVDQTVRAMATVYDSEDNVIDQEVRWSARPESAVREEGEPGIYTFLTEGYVEIEACASRSDGLDTCDYARLLVDADAPMLVVESPTPGQEMGGDDELETIEVRGSVADTRAVRVFVNGDVAEVGATGEFTAQVQPLFGVNHIEVIASDGINDDSRVEMDVLWADEYLTAVADDEVTPEVSFDEGMVLQLGQNFFDDGVPYDFETTPIRTEDLADILELVVANLDFGSLLPDPVIDSDALSLSITDTRLSNLDVVVDIVDGGADVFVRIGALEADTTGNLDFEGTMLDLGGGLTAGVSAFAHIDARKDGPEEPIVSEVTEVAVAVESLEGRFRSPEANAILRLAEGLLRTTLEDLIADVMNDTLISALPAVLTDALTALDELLRDQVIELDVDLFPEATIRLDGRLSSLSSEYRKWMRAPLMFTVGTSGTTAMHTESRGVADLTGTEQPPLFATRPVQLGLRLAVLNGLLHSLWNSGLLDIDATTILPDSVSGLVEEARLVGQMAPVIRPARGAETTDLVLSLGQAELEVVLLGDRVTFGLSLDAGVSATIRDGAIVLDIAEEPSTRVWTIAEEGDPILDEEGLELVLRDQLWPELRSAIADGLALEVPAFEVGDLTELTPELEGFGIGFELNDQVRVRQNWMMVDLAVVGAVSEPEPEPAP